MVDLDHPVAFQADEAVAVPRRFQGEAVFPQVRQVVLLCQPPFGKELQNAVQRGEIGLLPLLHEGPADVLRGEHAAALPEQAQHLPAGAGIFQTVPVKQVLTELHVFRFRHDGLLTNGVPERGCARQ